MINIVTREMQKNEAFNHNLCVSINNLCDQCSFNMFYFLKIMLLDNGWDRINVMGGVNKLNPAQW